VAAAATEPVLHTYVGRLHARPGTPVALVVGRDSAEAYLCDNRQVAALLSGPVNQAGSRATAELKGARGARLEAAVGGSTASGTVTLPGQPGATFSATAAGGAASLYQANSVTPAGLLTGGWDVGLDGQAVGAMKLNGVVVANPALQHTVSVGSGTLKPV
jgi:hypothetical protein